MRGLGVGEAGASIRLASLRRPASKPHAQEMASLEGLRETDSPHRSERRTRKRHLLFVRRTDPGPSLSARRSKALAFLVGPTHECARRAVVETLHFSEPIPSDGVPARLVKTLCFEAE
jgi:hypothetical protein